jgi:hypothetical protein
VEYPTKYKSVERNRTHTEREVFFMNVYCRIKPFNDDGNDATTKTITTKDRLL